MNAPDDLGMSEKRCCIPERAACWLAALKTSGKVSLVALNFAEDVLADVSANVAAALATSQIVSGEAATASSAQVISAIVLSIFANLSGLIYDVQQLGVNIPLPERDHWFSYLLHLLVALVVTSTYLYSTFNGTQEDFDPDPITNNTTFPTLIETADFSNDTLAGLAVLPTAGWAFSEGVGGFAFFAGKIFLDQTLRMLATERCRKNKADRPANLAALLDGPSPLRTRVDRLKNTLAKVNFGLNALGFMAVSLQAWISLFDVFAVTAASQFDQPVAALAGLRVLTCFLSLCLGAFFYDYYLREARESWVCKCVASMGIRLLATLGMASYSFAMSFNRARHFLNDIFAFPIELGESGFNDALIYASLMTCFNVTRYVLFCQENTVDAQAGERSRAASIFRPHTASLMVDSGSSDDKGRSHLPSRPSFATLTAAAAYSNNPSEEYVSLN
jgi:hypothetical protein